MDQNQNSNLVFINFRTFFSVIKKRKKVFIIAFAAVLILGLIYTFVSSPRYLVDSKIKLPDGDIYYIDALYKYFPQEANNLWILRSSKRMDYAVAKLDPISMEIKSDEVLDKVIQTLNITISKKTLSRSIDVNIDRVLAILNLSTFSKSPEMAADINKALLDSFTELKKGQLETVFNELMPKIEDKLSSLKTEIENPNQETEDIKEDYIMLNNIYENMKAEKDFFINRIEIIQQPEAYNAVNYSNYLRNILLSIISGFIIALIITYIFNYFKKEKNLL